MLSSLSPNIFFTCMDSSNNWSIAPLSGLIFVWVIFSSVLGLFFPCFIRFSLTASPEESQRFCSPEVGSVEYVGLPLRSLLSFKPPMCVYVCSRRVSGDVIIWSHRWHLQQLPPLLAGLPSEHREKIFGMGPPSGESRSFVLWRVFFSFHRHLVLSNFR